MNTTQRFCLWLTLVLSGYSTFGQDYILEKLRGHINTSEYHEISPSISSDGNTLYFTRVGYPEFEKSLHHEGHDLATMLTPAQYHQELKRIYSTLAGEQVMDPVKSGFNQDIWMARSVDGEFDQLQHPGFPLNNALPNSVCSLTPSSNEVIVINQFTENGGMKKGFSTLRLNENGVWSFPKALNINNYHNSGPDVNMTMSSDGRVLILALEREDAFGRSDLYVCFRQSDGSWSTPKNLGPYVNTAFRETTPFLSEDMRSIYYASDRGKDGSSDIFVQTRKDDSWEVWSAPKRFRYPINSKYNDSHPYFNRASGYLYFTSDRDGSSDIFKIQIEKALPKGLEVKGIVQDGLTGEPLPAIVLAGPNKGNGERLIYETSDGYFKITVPHGQQFAFTAQKEGFDNRGAEVLVQLDQPMQRGEQLVLKLFPKAPEEETMMAAISEEAQPMPVTESSNTVDFEVGDKIEMKPIYFQQSTSIVLHKSYPELDRLARLLKQNKNIYVEISGHTDNQGEEASLLKLSQDRANAIKDYLVYKKRIKPVRIKAIGLGDSQPVNDNSTDALRRKNRRVEVKITHVDKSTLGYRKEILERE